MKKTMLVIAGFGLASGLSMAAQEQETEAYDPNREMTTETEDPRSTMDDPRQDESDYGTAQTDPTERTGQEQMSQEQTSQEQTSQEQMTQEQMGHEQTDLTKMSAKELEGKPVQTATGEEIGEIDEVWTSTAGDERVATVEVGGFLGIGEKTIAVPVSDLQKATTGDGYQTSMTRTSIEAQPEFDESGYTREGATQDEGLQQEGGTTEY